MAQSVKTLSVYINLQSKAFTTGLRRMEMRLKKFGAGMSSIGSKMTSSITMPMALVGGASIKLASDFEQSMTKISTLVGLPTSEVEKLKESVKELSGTTAQAPQELADGLYFLTSAGLDAESAMTALESVSKAVAMGMGEQTDLAKVASSAQNAYGEEVLSASDALDIFGTMVKTGMFEASELANVLGSQLGLASNLGISMEELGAMISTYTRTTGSATDATTGLSGIMMSFAKITPKQETALKKIGLTGEELKTQLGEQGLQKTLLMLQKRFEENGVPLSEFFSKSQALKGVLGVLGQQTESYTEILGDMHNATGFVNEGFKETSETSAFKFQQALTDLKTAGVELGTAILPMANKIVNKISELAKGFSSMTDETQKKIIKTIATIMLIAPAISIIGALTTAFASLIGFVRTLGIVSKATALIMSLFNPTTYIFIAIGLILAGMIKHFDNLKQPIVDTINYIINLYNEFIGVRIAIQSIGFAFRYIKDVAIFHISNIINTITSLGKVLLNLFDKEERKKAIADFWSGLEDNVKDFADNTAENIETMMEGIENKDPIELISVEDIENGIKKGKEFGANLVDGVKSVMSNLSDGLSSTLFKGKSETPTTSGGQTDLSNTLVIAPEAPIVGALNQTLSKATESIQQWSESTLENWNNTFNNMANSVKGMGSQYAESFAGMVSTTIVEGGNLAQAFGDFIKQMLKDITAMLIKMVVFKALMTALGMPTGGGAGVSGVGNMIGSLFGFKDGGLVTGATPVLVGEGRGTSMSNPEVIAPLDKLRGYMGNQGSSRLHGIISGNDILLSNSRSSNTQDRVSGSVTNF